MTPQATKYALTLFVSGVIGANLIGTRFGLTMNLVSYLAVAIISVILATSRYPKQ